MAWVESRLSDGGDSALVDSLIERTVTSIKSNATSIGNYAFYNSTQLLSAEFPEAVSVGNYAFSGDSALANISLPKVENVGNYAFMDIACKKLSFPSLVSSTATAVFGNSVAEELDFPNLEQVITSGSTAGWFRRNKVIETVLASFFPKLKKLNSAMFNSCENLVSVNFPELEEVAEAFSGCTKLEDISFPKLKTLGGSTLTGTAITSFVGLLVESVGGSAFQNCTKLENVSLPECETFSSGRVFSGCTSLSDVNIPKLKSLPLNTFTNCTALQTLSLPALTSIENETAFSGCTGLQTLILHGMTTVNMSMLSNITNLKVLDLYSDDSSPITFLGTVPSSLPLSSFNTLIIRSPRSVSVSTLPTLQNNALMRTAFYKTGSGGTLYVPDRLIYDYLADFSWRRYFGEGSDRDLGNANNQILPIEGSIYE